MHGFSKKTAKISLVGNEPEKNPWSSRIVRLQSPFILTPVALVLFWISSGFTLEATRNAMVGILLCIFFSGALKYLFKTPRPMQPPAEFILDPYGFPSIHAAAASMVACCVTLQKSWMAPPAWILFILICWSRWKIRLHHFIDLAGGIVVGILVAFMLGWCL